MRIAIFNCNARSVPPKKSGGIEKVIDHLIDGYIELGHKVTLFSTGDSTRKEGLELISAFPSEIESMSLSAQDKNLLNYKVTALLGSKLIARQYDFDIIHNHCIDAALPVMSGIKNRLITTIHEALTFESIERLSSYRHLAYVSISNSQRRTFPDLHYIDTIYHGLDLNDYPSPVKPEDYLVFVGRISQQKNPHLAAITAGKLKKKLYIIGKYKDEDKEAEYYHNMFLPALKENSQYVEWIGEKDQTTVNHYLNYALASLHPVGFREPFGLAALESMACGCPAIAFHRGGYVETIEHGKTGFIVEDAEEMASAINKIDSIDRNYCRAYVERKFNIKTMVNNYVSLYGRLMYKHNGERRYAYNNNTPINFGSPGKIYLDLTKK